VRTADRTGVEMEALTAVAAAGLALIDMIKAVDPAAELDGVRVLRKEGGKTGLWERPS
jgi:cyclic pyranopterin monophosphate synthase